MKDKKFFQGHDRLAQERAKLWKTQQEAADHFGVSRVTWGQCERGNATPSGDVLAGLAALGADVLYVLTGQRSQALPAEATLPQDERALLDAYRACTPEARRNLIATAALLSAGMAPAAAPRAPAPAPTKMRMGDMVSNHAGSVQVGYAGGKVSVSTGGVKKSQKKAR